MKMANEEKKDNRSASERIGDLENAVMSLYQTVDNLARDTMTIKEAIKLLGNKTDSIIKVSVSGEPVNDDNVTKAMVQNNVEELARKVESMVAQGILVATDQTAPDSFIVGSELDQDNKTINPRLQFALYSFANKPEIQNKLLGSRPGDILTLEEGKLKFNVQEVYQIQQPKAPDAPVAETPAPAVDSVPTAEAAPAAPALTDTTTAPSAQETSAPTAPASTDAAPAAESTATPDAATPTETSSAPEATVSQAV